jgi:hypothetical protein
MTSLWLASVGLFGCVLAATPGMVAAREPVTTARIARVLSPQDGDRIPRKDQDPTCAEGRPCTRIFVDGRVEPGDWPFLAVAPLNMAPRIWIQPPITALKQDGRFSGMIYLGTERHGAGEKFNILVLAHPDKGRFREGDILTEIPPDCTASEPVTVLRTR